MSVAPRPRERKGSADAAVVKGSRCALLKAPDNLREEERMRLSAAAGLNAPAYRAYLLKEELRAPLSLRTEGGQGRTSRPGSRGRAARSSTPSSSLDARSVISVPRRRARGYTPSPLERQDGRCPTNKIGVMKHRAYAFTSFAALAAMVFLCCTDLQITVPI
jgi:hypothetical protein